MKADISFPPRIWKILFLQSRNILRQGLNEDRVQKSHFSEDEALMTTQVKNCSKTLLFRVVSLLMTQFRPRLTFKQFRNYLWFTMSGCSHEVSDDIPSGFSGAMDLLSRTKPSTSGPDVTYTELEDTISVPSVVGNSWFSPDTKLELGNPNTSHWYCPSGISIDIRERKITLLVLCPSCIAFILITSV